MRTSMLSLALVLLPGLASAQSPGGVASSGMGQGEARISARSDVRLSMESMPGTSGARVSALGARVGARMTQIRTCYTDILADTPTVTGTLRLRVLLEEGRTGGPTTEVDRDTTNNAALVRCISGVLGGVDVNGLQRPTRAVVQLEMANTAAAGAERAAVRAQEAAQVHVEVDGDGNVTSSGGTPDGHVRFRVVGQGRESAGAVVAAHRALLTALPGLLDCRRRAGRRGASSAGEVRATMVIHDGRAPTSRVTRCDVAGTRTHACMTRALAAIEQRSSGGSGTVAVTITFAEAEVVEGARD
ncbi:MAG: hypothetical protein H6719_16950 [Sandaracinaceae bacterium]|nr:hypothetical protein [Sandaracinaceae bacterium]